MKTPDEALDLILRNVAPLGEDAVSLDDAVGRVLSRDLVARENLPPFDNSAMDGFAVRAGDLRGAAKGRPVGLVLQETSREGTTAALSLKAGHAIKIMTGAPVPRGADAIAIKETSLQVHHGHVDIVHEPAAGDHIRRSGEDVRAGDLVLPAGRLLRPYEIALIAAQGVTAVPAIRRPRVRVIATGDELVAPSEPLSFGRIRNSNGPAIAAALRRWGVPPSGADIVRDDPAALERAVDGALAGNDVLLISGGVSVGDFDHTQDVLKKLGAEIVFWKVAIKPGKPLLFATLIRDGERRYVFGLPGNPVSALVCLEEFVRVALETLRGHQPPHPSYHLKGRATNSYTKPLDRQQYIFCQASEGADGFALTIIRPQGSAMMGMASQANALAIGAIGVGRINPGDTLAFRWLK